VVIHVPPQMSEPEVLLGAKVEIELYPVTNVHQVVLQGLSPPPDEKGDLVPRLLHAAVRWI